MKIKNQFPSPITFGCLIISMCILTVTFQVLACVAVAEIESQQSPQVRVKRSYKSIFEPREAYYTLNDYVTGYKKIKVFDN